MEYYLIISILHWVGYSCQYSFWCLIFTHLSVFPLLVFLTLRLKKHFAMLDAHVGICSLFLVLAENGEP